MSCQKPHSPVTSGYITSDCDADENVFSQLHFAASAEEAVRDVLTAGTDVDCGTFVQQNAQSAFNKSLINESLIDARVANLFRVRFRSASRFLWSDCVCQRWLGST